MDEHTIFRSDCRRGKESVLLFASVGGADDVLEAGIFAQKASMAFQGG